MIDKTELSNKIFEAASTMLSDIQSMSEEELRDNLRYFSEKCKSVAERILEVFITKTKRRYTEGEFAISDPEVLAKFVDFSTGYQEQMLNWIKKHPLEVKEEVFSLPQKPSADNETKQVQPKTIFFGGTIVSVGLFIFTNIRIALGAELLSVILAKVQEVRIRKSAEQKAIAKKHYLQAIEDKKNRLVNGMIDELGKWLDLGEEESNKILASFNL